MKTVLPVGLVILTLILISSVTILAYSVQQAPHMQPVATHAGHHHAAPAAVAPTTMDPGHDPAHEGHAHNSKGCVFKTVFGEESVDSSFLFKTPENVNTAIAEGLSWIKQAQHPNGGWGAGSHARQNVIDPHQVKTDPATTAMVAMALLRTGTTLEQGTYAVQLSQATEYLMGAVESTPKNRGNITAESGTQIQVKLGAVIDAVLTAQYFNNLLDQLSADAAIRDRVMASLNICVAKIQQAQGAKGQTRGAGWAGVLQSSFANTALEAAQYNGAKVDTVALNRSRAYQQANFDYQTGDVDVADGAGIMLYSVSSSNRSSAKEARKVRKALKKAKQEGKIADDVSEVTVDVLDQIGFTEDEALRYSTAYNVYESSKAVAQEERVVAGFGNNGGEEFLSFLQTGESMIINKDHDWRNWYDNTSGRLLKIQNEDGSWNGHHCITSPVFCTATCVLILSVNNDVEKLLALGEE